MSNIALYYRQFFADCKMKNYRINLWLVLWLSFYISWKIVYDTLQYTIFQYGWDRTGSDPERKCIRFLAIYWNNNNTRYNNCYYLSSNKDERILAKDEWVLIVVTSLMHLTFLLSFSLTKYRLKKGSHHIIISKAIPSDRKIAGTLVIRQ